MRSRNIIKAAVLFAACMAVAAYADETKPAAPSADLSDIQGIVDQYNSSVANTASDPTLIAKAKSLGYATKVEKTSSGGFQLIFTKIGKTPQGHGLLDKKWDQKDTVLLSYARDNDGYRLSSTKRTVEEKPPIGGWKTVSESAEIPTDLLASFKGTPK